MEKERACVEGEALHDSYDDVVLFVGTDDAQVAPRSSEAKPENAPIFAGLWCYVEAPSSLGTFLRFFIDSGASRTGCSHEQWFAYSKTNR